MSQVIRSKSDLKNVIRKIKENNSSIGLVPTMGALHRGHLELVQMSVNNYDITVASIFVNPKQFNKKEDLINYPKTEETDIEMLSTANCDYIFIPDVNEVYNKEPVIRLNFGYLEDILEGKHRPGHFNGVGIIVMKLFGLVEPNGAFFGQKDLQQFRVISTLVSDFDLPIKLHLAPTIREKSGLAISSRNKRLTTAELNLASVINTTLLDAKNQILNGVSLKAVLSNVTNIFKKKEGIELEYFEIVNAETLQHKGVVNDGDRLALCVAAFVADVRLIDNIIIDF